MRRDTFLHSLALLAGLGAVPAWAARPIRMMIPANPGGGWDATGRALGQAMQQARLADSVHYVNKGGAAGVLGLAQFIDSSRGDPQALMMTGSVMLGGIISGKPPVSLALVTPVARLTTEYNVFVVQTQSVHRSLADVIAQLRHDPASVRWGGGSRGSTEHIAAAMIARAVGVDPARINYVGFRGGGEAAAAVLGGSVTIGGSGYSEFAEYIRAGKMRPIAVTAATRLKNVPIPTLKEQGIDIEIGNWRGVYGAPGISPAQRDALTSLVLQATRSPAWLEALRLNDWTSAVLTGLAFEKFVADDYASLQSIMLRSGMV